MLGGPTELMRFIQLGMNDEALKGPIVWACMSCQTCTARCPQNIDIAGVVDTVKIMAQEQKLKIDTHGGRLFNRLWLTILKFTGRMYEVALIGSLNLLRATPFKDMGLGMKMFAKGKLKLFPSIRSPLAMMKMFHRARSLKK